MASQANILITICARGGSKGIPGKNIKLLGGRTLIDYTIQTAKKFAERHAAVITLSTDYEDILQAAAASGLVTDYRRPEYLATDEAGKIDVIRDIVLFEEKKAGKKFDYVLDLDVTSPLRTIEDLEKAFSLLLDNKEAITLFSVNAAARNPYFNMVEQKENGFYGLVKKLEQTSLTRQSAPKVYDLNASFYWYKRVFFDSGLKTPITTNTLIYQMNHICFDLDHVIDFEFLDFLITNHKLDFEL
ncbi:acylneuraminate cytidylyltransferase family protein [Cytophaga aurantiaca]|uniref:acylneuraminate cytidylyltransferase family protein n=1 Tax=Cytophaga aurantiaca TaxID=29530 RepID=UPI000363EE3F|nr:acylneuraminate cytidylyltransferase family protein [Cytophaga aurantiaca]